MTSRSLEVPEVLQGPIPLMAYQLVDDLPMVIGGAIPLNVNPPSVDNKKEEAQQQDEAGVKRDVTPLSFQYTPVYSGPNISCSSCLQSISDSVANHDILSYTPLASLWSTATWDGTTVWNPCVLTKEQVLEGIWPGAPSNTNTPWVMRGLKELYDSFNPFVDSTKPTIHEVELWNVEVLRHFRRLLGYTDTNAPLTHSPDLYYRAQWATERKKTDYWDTKYPGVLDSLSGPCVGGTNAHCGFTFLPDCTDQTPYLMNGDTCVTSTANSAEGIFPVYPNLPWSLCMSQILRLMYNQDGFAGHILGLATKPNVGMGFYCGGTNPQLRVEMNGVSAASCPP